MAAQRPRQSKVLRKIRRKQAQFHASEPELCVTFLDQAESLREQDALTREYHFFIGNGGTRNGISREVLTALLGNVDSLYMPEAKDFSFASVTGQQQALHLLHHCNGVCVQDTCKIRNLCHLISPSLLEGPPLYLYLSLIDCIPTSLIQYDDGHKLPPGLILTPDFVSVKEERELLDYFTHSEFEGQCEQACSTETLNPTSVLLQHSSSVPTTPSLLEVHGECDDPTITDTKGLTPADVIHFSHSTSFHNSKSIPPPITSILKHRRVFHYGYEFLYGSNTVDPTHPLPGGIPAVCTPLLQRLRNQGLLAWLPDQLTVNDYLPGAGIHIYCSMYICLAKCKTLGGILCIVMQHAP